MSTPAQNTQHASLQHSPTLDADLPTSDNRIKPHAASEEPAVSTEADLAKIVWVAISRHDTLDILDVLRGSTIAEQRGKYVDLKFWSSSAPQLLALLHNHNPRVIW